MLRSLSSNSLCQSQLMQMARTITFTNARFGELCVFHARAEKVKNNSRVRNAGQIKNQELRKGNQYFQNALLILVVFRNKYGRAVTVGSSDVLTKQTDLEMELNLQTKSKTYPRNTK